MAENKTRESDASVEEYIGAIPEELRRKDCEVLVSLMTKITQHKPKMWGPSIIGFGSYHYKYDSGREGDSCITGFASRKRELSIYLVASGPDQAALLTKLGKHKMGKACLYINKLGDVDLDTLELLLIDSVSEVRRRHM